MNKGGTQVKKRGTKMTRGNVVVGERNPANNSASARGEEVRVARVTTEKLESKIVQLLRESVAEVGQQARPLGERRFAKPPQRRPFTFRLAEPDIQRLREIQELTEADSVTGVILDALSAYDFIVEQYEKGQQICFSKPDALD